MKEKGGETTEVELLYVSFCGLWAERHIKIFYFKVILEEVSLRLCERMTELQILGFLCMQYVLQKVLHFNFAKLPNFYQVCILVISPERSRQALCS